MKCRHEDCEKEALEQSEQCVLHIEKKSYGANYQDRTLFKFNKALIEYIVDSFFLDGKEERDHFTKDNIKSLLSAGNDRDNAISEDIKQIINNEINSEACFLDSINFPERKSRDYFDYYKVLNKLPRLWFNNCSFISLTLGDLKPPSFYDSCIFYGYVYLSDVQVLSNVSSSLFQFCVFKSEVEFYPEKGEHELNNNFFHGCEISKLSLHRALIKGELIREERDAGDNAYCLIDELHIDNVVFNNKFTLNNSKVKEIYFANISFEEKVELKQTRVNNIEIDNCNFKKVTDLYGSKFNNFLMHKCICHDFIGFEACVFGGDVKSDRITSYKYVTFLDFANFRSSVFNGGLDFKYTNTKLDPNFLDAEINEENTKRETFRIIKNSFDSVGNYIDANHFYGLEMISYSDEVSFLKQPFTKLMLLINKYASRFGQSYIWPLFWLLFFLGVFELLFIGYKENILYQLVPSYNDKIRVVASSVNSFAGSVLLLKKFYIEGMEFVCLIFIVIYSALTYQLVVALRRLTKR